MNSSLNSRAHRVFQTTHTQQVNELLSCGGWVVLCTCYDPLRKAPSFVLGQYEPFRCPKCGASLGPEQVRIDFVMGHEIACPCSERPVRLSGLLLNEYFNQ
jgi:hypothetical protein